jgi:DNA-binding protein H-NS
MLGLQARTTAENEMAFDLSTYNLAELKGLQFDVAQEIKKRERQELGKAREQILAIARETGVAVDELLEDEGKGRKRKG